VHARTVSRFGRDHLRLVSASQSGRRVGVVPCWPESSRPLRSRASECPLRETDNTERLRSAHLEQRIRSASSRSVIFQWIWS